MAWPLAAAHTDRMKKSLFAGLLVAVIVSGFSGVTALVLSADSSTRASSTDVKTRDADGKSALRDDHSRGFGPPAWAKAEKPKHHARPLDDDWRTAWRALTPAQRKSRMQALAKAHTEGMQKWHACATKAGTDSAKRATCEKPTPPGHAKRRP
jgi:hypothetical protein